MGEAYDHLHLAITRSQTMQRLWRHHACGVDYPGDFDHVSFLTRAELERVRAELRLTADGILGDLACGTGGPGLWIVRHTGARLIGIDLSRVAIAEAQHRSVRLGLENRASYRCASFDHTGLGAESLDALLSIDALTYAADPSGVLREAARILRQEARFVGTTFELDRELAARLTPRNTGAVDDYRPLFEAAGFGIVRYEETPGWAERIEATYAALVEAGPRRLDVDAAALDMLLWELSLAVEHRLCRRRVLFVAERR